MTSSELERKLDEAEEDDAIYLERFSCALSLY